MIMVFQRIPVVMVTTAFMSCNIPILLMKSFTCPRIPEIYEWLLLCPNPGKELMPMVTYGDLFEFVIMLCAVITLVLAIINAKK